MHLLFRVLILGLLLLGPAYPLGADEGDAPLSAADYESVFSLRADIEELLKEKQQTDKKIEANITLIEKEQAKWVEIREEAEEKMAAVKQEIVDIPKDRPEMESKCSGEYAEGNPYDTAVSECLAVLDPFNERVQKTRDNYDWIEKNAIPVLDKKARLQKENATLQMQRIRTIRKVARLKKLLPLVASRECASECDQEGMVGEAEAQCLQHCMDNARRPFELPRLEDVPVSSNANVIFPDWKNTQNRTPEEAIEEYKKGERAGPKTLKTSEPPPPGH